MFEIVDWTWAEVKICIIFCEKWFTGIVSECNRCTLIVGSVQFLNLFLLQAINEEHDQTPHFLCPILARLAP